MQPTRLLTPLGITNVWYYLDPNTRRYVLFEINLSKPFPILRPYHNLSYLQSTLSPNYYFIET